MIMMGLAVAFLDGLVVFLQVREREEWVVGHTNRAIGFEGLTAAAIYVTIMAIKTYDWNMFVPSVGGSMIGRWLASKI